MSLFEKLVVTLLAILVLTVIILGISEVFACWRLVEVNEAFLLLEEAVARLLGVG